MKKIKSREENKYYIVMRNSLKINKFKVKERMFMIWIVLHVKK